MVTVVFWNIRKNPSAMPRLASIARHEGVDVFLLAEYPADLPDALEELGRSGAGVYREADNAEAKVRAITRLGPEVFTHRFTNAVGDLGIWSLRTPGIEHSGELLLAGVHLRSKMGGISDDDQAGIARQVVLELNDEEDRHRHRSTGCVGDFNMNPYDPGMTSVDAFHAQMTRRLAELPDRPYRKLKWRRFYNPMWGLFGDRTAGPPGSYYWEADASHNPHWCMLDQLLLRPELIDRLKALRLLDHDGTRPLTRANGSPDVEQSSDHFPLLFELDI